MAWPGPRCAFAGEASPGAPAALGIVFTSLAETTIPAFAIATASVFCADGHHAISGGYTTGSGDLYLFAQLPIGAEFRIGVLNNSATSETINVYAICVPSSSVSWLGTIGTKEAELELASEEDLETQQAD